MKRDRSARHTYTRTRTHTHAHTHANKLAHTHTHTQTNARTQATHTHTHGLAQVIFYEWPFGVCPSLYRLRCVCVCALDVCQGIELLQRDIVFAASIRKLPPPSAIPAQKTDSIRKLPPSGVSEPRPDTCSLPPRCAPAIGHRGREASGSDCRNGRRV